jgi:MFS family permease
MALAASGNYFAGALWPTLLQWGISTIGWRQAHLIMGIASFLTIVPLALMLRTRAPMPAPAAPGSVAPRNPMALGLSPNVLQTLIILAGITCCIAMAMPQVHIVAYCVDLGFGAARGAQMLSVMLASGIASRLIFGFIMDRIGGVRTLVLSSLLQGIALLMFLPSDGLMALFLVSFMFGLFQGGLVPCYAMIVRENFPPSQAGSRVGLALSSTMVGMAIGGWMAGALFDATGGYTAAMWNGIAWNLVNLSIALGLLWRLRAFSSRVVSLGGSENATQKKI